MNADNSTRHNPYSEYTGKNSLKEKQIAIKAKAITKSLQKISYPPERAFTVIVEGNDDIPIYSPVFNNTLCKIIPLWGVDNVKYIFKKFQTGHDKSKAMKQVLMEADSQNKINKLTTMRNENKVIGIIDLDFEKERCIKNLYSPQHYSNLFVTETNDAQILLLNNYGLVIFIRKLCDQGKVEELKKRAKIGQLFQQIILMTNHPGLARYVDKRLKTEIAGYRSLNFQILHSEDVFNEYISCGKILTSDDIQELLFCQEGGNTYNVDFIQDYKKKGSMIEFLFPDRWDVCQGHDMMRVLLSIHRLVGCGEGHKNENDLIEDISNIFHLPKNAFFKNTSLFSALKKWERDYFPYPANGMFSVTYSTIKKYSG